MHDVVMAAAMTVTPDDLGTVDPDLDPPTPVGLLLLPSPRRVWLELSMESARGYRNGIAALDATERVRTARGACST
jgi:hypothetical protein